MGGAHKFAAIRKRAHGVLSYRGCSRASLLYAHGDRGGGHDRGPLT